METDNADDDGSLGVLLPSPNGGNIEGLDSNSPRVTALSTPSTSTGANAGLVDSQAGTDKSGISVPLGAADSLASLSDNAVWGLDFGVKANRDLRDARLAQQNVIKCNMCFKSDHIFDYEPHHVSQARAGAQGDVEQDVSQRWHCTLCTDSWMKASAAVSHAKDGCPGSAAAQMAKKATLKTVNLQKGMVERNEKQRLATHENQVADMMMRSTRETKPTPGPHGLTKEQKQARGWRTERVDIHVFEGDPEVPDKLGDYIPVVAGVTSDGKGGTKLSHDGEDSVLAFPIPKSWVGSRDEFMEAVGVNLSDTTFRGWTRNAIEGVMGSGKSLISPTTTPTPIATDGLPLPWGA